MIPRMKNVAKEYGIQMEYDGYVGNTFDSHVSCVMVVTFSYNVLKCTLILLFPNQIIVQRLIWKAFEVSNRKSEGGCDTVLRLIHRPLIRCSFTFFPYP